VLPIEIFADNICKTLYYKVDVDFRPSANLRQIVHSGEAAKAVFGQQKVVVVPAFEVATEKCCPTDISALRNMVVEGHAEGFHRSHFPQGHGPT